MTQSRRSLPSVRLNRPKGYFPRRTSLGLTGVVILTAGIPMVALECAAPFVRGGFEQWLSSAPFAAGLGFVFSIVIAFSMVTHRYWAVCLFFYAGSVLLAAYGLTTLFALAAVAGLFTSREAGLSVLPIVGLIMLGFMGVFAWFLLRALRLRYWQPWTAPETWEAGDESPPAWSLSPRR